MDIDLSLKNEVLTKKNISKIIEEIINIDINDGAIIVINEIDKIREMDEYGGYRVKLTVKIENIKELFNIDIATGDPITPREINFKYKTIFDYKFINLKSYNLETVLAEKLETILSRKELNGRIKDFYDVYLICNLARNKLDKKILKCAIKNTFKKRDFNGNIEESLKVIKESTVLKKRWQAFSRQNKYAKNINYEDITLYIKTLIENFV